MAEFKDRLEEAMQMRNIKPAELAKLTGIGEGAISQYRKGAYKASQRNLEKISRVLNVSIPWLMGCDEEKPTTVSDDGLSDSERQMIKLFRLVPPEDRGTVAGMIEGVLRHKGLLK